MWGGGELCVSPSSYIIEISASSNRKSPKIPLIEFVFQQTKSGLRELNKLRENIPRKVPKELKDPDIKRGRKGRGLIRNKTVRATKPAQSLKVNWVIFCVTAYPFYRGH